jgi:hypothetical protein
MIDIETLTLKEIRQIAALACPPKAKRIEDCEPRPVVVRSSQSGVWFGNLVSRHGKSVRLTNARKIWSWQGANTTSDIALAGVGKGSKVAPPVTVTVTECHEILDATAVAAATIEARSWGT